MRQKITTERTQRILRTSQNPLKPKFTKLPFLRVDFGGLLGEDAVRAFVTTLGYKEFRFE